MTPLPKQYTGRGEVRGYNFRQIHATDRAFLYEVSLNGSVIHFEVFRRKSNKRFKCTSYPGAKSFGLWAWTYKSLEKSMQKFNQLNNYRTNHDDRKYNLPT